MQLFVITIHKLYKFSDKTSKACTKAIYKRTQVILLKSFFSIASFACKHSKTIIQNSATSTSSMRRKIFHFTITKTVFVPSVSIVTSFSRFVV